MRQEDPEEKEAYKDDIDFNEFSSIPPRAKKRKVKIVEPEPEVNDYNSPREDIPL